MHAYKVIDLKNTAGVIPVEINDRMYVNDSITSIHYLNLTSLKNEIESIDYHIDQLKTSTIETSLLKPLRIMKSNLDEKYIKLTGKTITRQKRGLINALGSAISWVTGNMDADDKQHYEKILLNLETNQQLLLNNEHTHSHYNTELIDRLNKDFNEINSNNKIIEQTLNKESSIIEQLIVVQALTMNVNILDRKLDNILVGLEKCIEHELHHSILSINELEYITLNMSNLLASKKIEMIWRLSTVNCIMSNKAIMYIIKLPKKGLISKTYSLVSYPSKINENYFKINIDIKQPISLLKEVVLLDQCLEDERISYCKRIKTLQNACINEIMKNENLKNCEVQPITKPSSFVNFNEECQCITGYNANQLEINNEKVNVPDGSFIVHLAPSDMWNDKRLPKIYKESKSLILTSSLDHLSFNSNITLANIVKVKEEQKINLIKYITESEPEKYLLFVIISAIIMFITVIVYIWNKKRNNANYQTAGNQFPLIMPSQLQVDTVSPFVRS
jgi:hypothetical protein